MKSQMTTNSLANNLQLMLTQGVNLQPINDISTNKRMFTGLLVERQVDRWYQVVETPNEI